MSVGIKTMVKFSFCFGWWKFKKCVSVDINGEIHDKATVLAVLEELRQALGKVGVKASIIVSI